MTKRPPQNSSNTKPVIIVAGPTASGKSSLAMTMGKALGGPDKAVIINADSMQLYRELRIVTACPTPADRRVLPHALYQVLNADEPNSAMHWRKLALNAITAAHDAGQTPILVGGTGFYIKALIEGLSPIPTVPEQITMDTRARLAEEGVEALHRALKNRDPVMAARLRSSDGQRVARAWAVLQATGMSLADWQALDPEPPPDHLQFYVEVVMPDRAWLYKQCDYRFALMAATGGLDEVSALLAMELPPSTSLLRAVGVPELASFIRGERELEAAITAGQQATRHYAKRQFTWFRNQLPDNGAGKSRRKPSSAQKLQVSHVQNAQLSESFKAFFGK
ncbi:MAG: tRNA (adenosine(37)-N6)-dimethylallyltransferase MiaA [Pseudomonadota bacterium]